jgi:hypothetical protein
MDVPWQFVHTVMILEGCISKVKAELKRVKADTARKLRNALRRAYAKVTLADIRGWFRLVVIPFPECSNRKRFK